VLKGYTTTDASVLTTIAFVSQFDLKCGGAVPPPTANFYAEVGGRHLNVAKSSKTGSFQVSWTEEIHKASRGDYKINVYDEDTFAQVRKVSQLTVKYI
jgi:translocon-associated protein subunit delta